MDFKNMRWYDYAILLALIWIAAQFVIPSIGALFSVGDDESGLTTAGLIIIAPIVVVFLYMLLKALRRK